MWEAPHKAQARSSSTCRRGQTDNASEYWFPFSLIPSSPPPFSTLLWDHFPSNRLACVCLSQALLSGWPRLRQQSNSHFLESESVLLFQENPLYIGQISLATRSTPQNPLTPWFPEVPRQSEDEQSGTQVKAGSRVLTSYCPVGTGKPSLNRSQRQLSLDVEDECQAGDGSWLEVHWWAGPVGGMEISHLLCRWSQSLVKSLSLAFTNQGEDLHVLKPKQ